MSLEPLPSVSQVNDTTTIMWSPPVNQDSFDLDYYIVTVRRQSDMSVVVQTTVTDVRATLALPQNGNYVAEVSTVNKCGDTSPPTETQPFSRGE